jgi:hypothetical protein
MLPQICDIELRHFDRARAEENFSSQGCRKNATRFGHSDGASPWIEKIYLKEWFFTRTSGDLLH